MLDIQSNLEKNMSDSPAFLADRLRNESEKTLAFFQALSATQWEQTIYIDKAPWNARQVLAHLVATEEMVRQQIESILGGGAGISDDFDIDTFNLQSVARLEYNSFVDLLGLFSQYRLSTIALVEHLIPDDLTRQGRHPYLGIATMVEVIKLIYRHNQIHQREIRKVLSEA
jgi:hypothetical protein